jgi:aryl-alcohol dehydrogenase-like predicted oxidoreductase
VRYVGYSNLAAWQAASLLATQRQHGYTPLVSAQMYYSLLGRDIEYGVTPFLRHEGLGLLVWSPLAGGFLSGKYTNNRDTQEQPADGRLASFDYLSILSIDHEKGERVVATLREIAAAHGEATPAQVALAWLLAKPAVSSVIIAANKPEQFADNLAAVNLSLMPQELETLDTLTEPQPLYPYKWRASGGDPLVRQALFPGS